MVVGPQATLGTIGGGQLEYMAIDAARAMLARGGDATSLDIPLGPEIGQCCGGRTLLSVARLDDPGWAALRARAVAERKALPEVLIFGAGHVGRALGAALALLPVRPVLVDQRMEELHLAAPGLDVLLTPLPEETVRGARPGHRLRDPDPRPRARLPHRPRGARPRRRRLRRDDRLADQARLLRALARRDRGRGGHAPPSTDALVSPIGAAGRPDKRPEVIAAFVAAEIMQALIRWHARHPAHAGSQKA